MQKLIYLITVEKKYHPGDKLPNEKALAEELGVSIVQLLRVQGDMQRNKRFSLAEKLANEAAVKIIFPVVFCILPSVLIVIFGPLALQVLQMFRVG